MLFGTISLNIYILLSKNKSMNFFHLQNPVATAFEIFWMLCEPILFGLTGAQVVLSELEFETVIHGGAFILICFIVSHLLINHSK